MKQQRQGLAARLGAGLHGLLELPWLMLLNLWNHLWNFALWIGEIRRYYGNGRLLKADLLWMIEYGFSSPFTLSRKATQREGLPEDLTVYGETPWTTLALICDSVKLAPGERFVDLGAGTGRNLLFVHYAYGARALGFELVPRFVEKFAWLQHHLQLAGVVELRQQNWLDEPLSGDSATDVFCLVGSCYSDAHLDQAARRLAELPAGTRVVTVSYALPPAQFALEHEQGAAFSWGKGTIYFQRRR